MKEFGYILQDLIVPVILISVATILISMLLKIKRVFYRLKPSRVLIIFLIVWSFIGFLTQEDFTERCGCFDFSRGIFSLDYIIFSLVSLSAFTFSLFSRSRKTILILLFSELIYWLLKLMFLKSGYLGGLGIPIFSYYDYIGLTSRFLLINHLLKRKLNYLLIPLLSGIIITFKFLALPCQENFIYEDYLKPLQEERLLDRLSGKWEGTLNYKKDTTVFNSYDSTRFTDLVLISDTVTYRDSILNKIVEGVQIEFKDTILIINEKVPDYTGEYALDFIKPGFNYLSFLPVDLSSNSTSDDSTRQYSIPLNIEEINEKEMNLNINQFKFTLKKTSQE